MAKALYINSAIRITVKGDKMRETLLNIKNQFRRTFFREEPEDSELAQDGDYVEIGKSSNGPVSSDAKITVKPYTIEHFEDIKQILQDLREGRTVALINMSVLKEKDMVELKRAINKLKKTCDAIDGDIAGFGENYIVAVPEFARVHRGGKSPSQPQTEFDDDSEF